MVEEAFGLCLQSWSVLLLMLSPLPSSPKDWNQTAYGLPPPFERGDAGNILPLVLQYLTPTWLSVLGIGSVAAAVMSSMDSALLSSASMFTQNIYKATLRKQVCLCGSMCVSALSKVTAIFIVPVLCLLAGLRARAAGGGPC